MTTDSRVARGWVSVGLTLFASLAVLDACSAKAGSTIGGGSGAQINAGNVGNTGNGPNGNGGGGGLLIGGSDNGGVIIDVGSGGTSAGGMNGSGGLPVTSDGHIGPPMTNKCADASKFQSATGAIKLLYPYDGTVFPRGLGAPLFMWDQNIAADQIYIEATSGKWSYIDCPQTPDKVRYQLDDVVWKGPPLTATVLRIQSW